MKTCLLDGDLHVAGTAEECCRYRECRACGGRAHQQSTYFGLVLMCERCDAKEWEERSLEERVDVVISCGYEP